MKIPNTALPYILYQRTNYLVLPRMSLISRLPYKWLVAIEVVFRKKAIIEAFLIDIQHEVELIRPFFPSRIKNMLDIGFGIGGIDVLIYQVAHPGHMYLLDKNMIENSIWYGFESSGASYNSLKTAGLLLDMNDVPTLEYTLINIESEPFPIESFDLIISLISWGFHYPISTYLDKVKQYLSPRGVLIIDVRKGTGGEEALKDSFKHIEVIKETSKSKRLACRLLE